jgi:predicted RNA-binding protein Jag
MYDPMSEAHEFIGHDRGEALAKATAFFGVGEDELAVAEVDSSKASGIGARFVLVAYCRSAGPPARRPGGEGRRDREGPRDRGEAREARGGRRERGDRDRDRGGRDRDRGRGDRGRDREPRRGREREEEEPRAAAPAPEPTGPSTGTATTALTPVGEFVCGLVERMGLGGFEIAEPGETEGIDVIQLRGPAAARIASGEGRAVDAIQLLANQAALRIGGEDAKRVVIEMEGGADQRSSLLEKIASRAAQRARETGRPVALEAMSPRDRRTVHMALREADGIATMSVGEGRYRQVVVVPESASEYAEAKRYEVESQRENRD